MSERDESDKCFESVLILSDNALILSRTVNVILFGAFGAIAIPPDAANPDTAMPGFCFIYSCARQTSAY